MSSAGEGSAGEGSRGGAGSNDRAAALAERKAALAGRAIGAAKTASGRPMSARSQHRAAAMEEYRKQLDAFEEERRAREAAAEEERKAQEEQEREQKRLADEHQSYLKEIQRLAPTSPPQTPAGLGAWDPVPSESPRQAPLRARPATQQHAASEGPGASPPRTGSVAHSEGREEGDWMQRARDVWESAKGALSPRAKAPRTAFGSSNAGSSGTSSGARPDTGLSTVYLDEPMIPEEGESRPETRQVRIGEAEVLQLSGGRRRCYS
mmetsp:Transcript_22212/g.69114  ORF Transcript_22212/g.69114 Transcript_22212/m.69114 type:complete len:265 (+) Transcript_22212:277-1071(+)